MRLTTGAATLAEVQQLELRRARIGDAIDGLAERERAAAAELLGLVAAPLDGDAPTASVAPRLELSSEDPGQLEATLADHPALDTLTSCGKPVRRRGWSVEQHDTASISTRPAMDVLGSIQPNSLSLALGVMRAPQ